MSVKTMGAVWELDLSAPKLLILLALADHADHNGDNVYPSVRLIAWKTGYSKRQVQRIIQRLVKDELLRPVEIRPGRTTKYRIDILSGVKKNPLENASNVIRQNVIRQNVTPDITVSPLPMTSDVTPTPDITVSPEPSLEPSLEPSIKEKEIPFVDKRTSVSEANGKIILANRTKEELLAITDPAEQKAIAQELIKQLTGKGDSNTKQRPYTREELDAQIAAMYAKHGMKAEGT